VAFVSVEISPGSAPQLVYIQGGEDAQNVLYLDHFLQKRPMISGSCAERGVQLQASYAASPPCMSYIFSDELTLENFH